MRSLEQITQDIQGVIEHSQEYFFKTNASEIAYRWYKEKKFYIDLFGGETIYLAKENISIELTEEDKDKAFEKFLEDVYNKGVLYNTCSTGMSFREFLECNRSGFYDNRVVYEIPSIKIIKGMKLLKCFKFFISDFTQCRELQDIASRYIQGVKVKGNLYLSVDPLDYLSISENNNNWRSCHALDGEFRSGNMTYMLDETTIIAYLAPAGQVQLKSFPDGLLWNNKRWRMLVHTNKFKTIIYYNRQYPFTNEGLEKDVWKSLEEICGRRFIPPTEVGVHEIIFNGKPFTLDYNYLIGERGRLYDTREVINDLGSLGYDDLIYSPFYTPRISIGVSTNVYSDSEYLEDWDQSFHEVFDISIGKPCYCLKCGENKISRADSFLCDECIAEEDCDEDNFLRCNCCGRRLYSIEEGFMVGGELLCKTCLSATIEEPYRVSPRRCRNYR